ncbi:hypothetical protein KUTeg_013921 [Tegillarca granosa]|uniref:Signal recognition particle 14 kDa protein n=1 Tax=Tegillarca granosa TaxID=220873 RepID=A0ABQ9EYH3_TEGGR|nr:hypothetical protein KUTeg_013921 [Tegillarca granosa]
MPIDGSVIKIEHLFSFLSSGIEEQCTRNKMVLLENDTVDHKDVNRFQMAYSNLLKGNMDGLKKKDKKATTKGKSKATQ